MKKTHKLNNRGFSSVEIAFSVTVVLVIAALGARVIMNSHAQSPNSNNSVTSTPATLTLATTNPKLGGNVSLTATHSVPKGNVPEMSLTCTQSGVQTYLNVFTESSIASPWTQSFALNSPSLHMSESANCIGSLYYYTWTGKKETGVVNLAQVNFAVQPK